MAIDPVCAMTVDEEKAQWTSEHHGKTYFFCSPGCQKSFEQDPEKYLDGSQNNAEHPHHSM